jgi:RNA polymerase sigma factor (TIGR02999 family)
MDTGKVSTLVREANTGDGQARDRLFAELYDELHRLASRELRRNGAVPLSPTTLVHETFLNISQREATEFSDLPRFMAYAGRAMRGLVIDSLRRGGAQKRGGEFEITSLDDNRHLVAANDVAVVKLREALDTLEKIDARLAECVDLKFFCGLSFGDIAKLWDVSERTVQRDWEKAKLLLNHLLGADPVAQQMLS